MVPKKRGNLQTNFRSQESKRSTVLQDGNYSFHSSFGPRGSIYENCGFKGRKLHVPIYRDHHKFLRLAFLEKHFQFVAFPFGLATTPRIFSKVLGSLLAVLQLRGIAVVPYLDDILVQTPSFQQARSHTEMLLSFLRSHGWKVHLEKSFLVPSTRVTFLGTIIDFLSMKIFLMEVRKSKIFDSCLAIQSAPRPSVAQCMEVVGLMVAAMDIIPFTRFHLRSLQLYMLSQWDGYYADLSPRIQLKQETRDSLQWWLSQDHLSQGTCFHRPSWVIVTTDTSLLGWGAVWGRTDSEFGLRVCSTNQHSGTKSDLQCSSNLAQVSLGPVY
ncbi:uncharacterized protein LOC128643535 [Bombina bombina]|uniref:uncharacterized protein LOC128643535 n=1 Tax=Bombina bombina TaxID=8345 RepID=UPI00235ABFF8|nr:uncharacterized protein LOC128643535 [Bombina bombina]